MILDFISFLKEYQKWIIISLCALLILLAIVIWVIKKERKKEKITIQRIATIGIFAGLSSVLYILDFSLPLIFPEFLKINFSALPILIIAFLLGPTDAVTICIIRTILKFILKGSGTAGVGEVMDFIVSSSVALVVSYIYSKNRSMKGAAVSLVFGAMTWVVVALIANWLVIVPLYILMFFDGNSAPLIGMLSMVLKNVTGDNYMWKYLLMSALPFNILLSSVISLITFAVYKPISFISHKLVEEDYEID